MKCEVIRPSRWSPSRLLIAVLITYTGWSVSRVLEGCAAPEPVPAPVVKECSYGEWLYDGGYIRWRCSP